MTRRIAAILAALLLAAVPVTAQEPRGAVTLVVLYSNGSASIPVASGVLPLICEPAL